MSSIGEVLYLSRFEVERLNIPMREVIRIVEEVFREKAEGRAEIPPKPGIHPQRNAFIHAMPAYIPKMRSAGVKWVSGFPENPKRGLPYILGLLILNDLETGVPICVMDCTWITAKRTGAATAVAAKHLAREDSRILGILGCGVQGRSNLEALTVVCKNLEEVKAYDVNEGNLQKYVKEMTTKYGIKVVPVDSPRKAVEDCDIVVTAGPILEHPRPVIEASWFKDGGFACPLDFDSYWKPEVMHSMDKFCTDDKDQLTYYKKLGYFSGTPHVYADLGEVVSGKKPGRENPKERIMSMNLGLAIEDMATAILIYEKAKKVGVGTRLPL
ncbi:MAG: ornithine cyclodeaminase family protein [Candidatus Bathyarchaeia archaeon]